MATFTNNRGTGSHTGGGSVVTPYLLEEVIDFGTNNGATSDVFETINIPAGSVVLNAGVEVVTAEAGTGTVALSSSSPSVTYVAASGTTSTGYLTSGDAVGEMFVVYPAADTLDITVGTAARTSAVIRVWALVADLQDGAQKSTQTVTFT